MQLTRLHKPISYTRELHLCDTSKKVTSKLHKLTNYKSNYTSTIYKIEIQAYVKGNANQREDKDDTMIFIPRFTWLSPS